MESSRVEYGSVVCSNRNSHSNSKSSSSSNSNCTSTSCGTSTSTVAMWFGVIVLTPLSRGSKPAARGASTLQGASNGA